MRLEYTDLALDDIESITDYIAHDSLPAAARVERRIRDALALLADQPTIMGKAGRIAGTGEVVIAPYIVVYQVRSKVIEVFAVIHGHRGNIAQIISDRLDSL